jgi:hypothetical protein
MSQSSNEARIILALQALQNNPDVSTRRAAEIYQVGRMQLWRRQQGIQSRRDSGPNSRRLSDLEEQTIVQFILDLDSRGFPSRQRVVEEMANSLLADRDAPPSASDGLITSLSDNQSLRHGFFVNTTIRELNAKI